MTKRKKSTSRKREIGWSKKARDKGYRAERDGVLLLRRMGCWAKRLRSDEQIGEMRCVDGYYWDPARFIFGFEQTKYQRKYLHKEEKDRIIELCTKYNVEGMFMWREPRKGMKFEIIRELVK